MPDVPFFWEAVFWAGVAWSLLKIAARFTAEVADPDINTHDTWVEPPDLDQALHDGGMKPADVAKLDRDQRRSTYESLEAARASGFASLVRCPGCGTALGAAGMPLGYVTSCPGCQRSLHIVITEGRPHVTLT